jgi:hypothetical protein
MRSFFAYVWSDWRFGYAIVIGLCIIVGLMAAKLTPRGPVTPSQALVSMFFAILIGLTVGFVTGSRWSMLVTPVFFVIVFEIARLSVDGPTVDGIHLSSTFGIFAFVLGRLFHSLLVLAPMVLGASYGIWLATRFGRDASATMGALGWTFSTLVTLVLVALAVLLSRPGTTHPITGSDGQLLPASIAELATVPIGGHDQVMMIRVRSTENPVLLYLAGGPGGTDLGAMRADVTLEQHFVVVTWDQRGTGKSYTALDPTDTLTLEQMLTELSRW